MKYAYGCYERLSLATINLILLSYFRFGSSKHITPMPGAVWVRRTNHFSQEVS